jgi:Bor protein
VRARRWLLAAILASASSGCYRTVYRNLEPSGPTVQRGDVVRRPSAWRNFFLYGWVPREARVNAAEECGSAENVREIRTRRSFSQGLVATFASSSGINVYSPWMGEVVCIDGPAARGRPARHEGRR